MRRARWKRRCSGLDKVTGKREEKVLRSHEREREFGRVNER